MAKKQTGGVSLAPSTYAEGGGLLDNVDVTFGEVGFEMWDYNGKVPVPVPALKIVMEVEPDGEEATQYWSAGNPKDWVPSDDGSKLLPVGTAQAINSGSNMAHFVRSLIEAGFPEDKIEDDVGVFVGLECHLVRAPAPKRTGLARAPRADGREFEATVLVVDSISKLPWEKGHEDGAAPGVAKEGGGDLSEKATGIIMEILEKNPKGLEKKKLASMVFAALKTDDDRNAAVALAYKDDFLSTGPWAFENGVVGG